MRATGLWRLWAPLIGIASGSVVAVLWGLYDPGRLLDAKWFYLPNVSSWPGFDITPGPEFWTLLPAFLLVSLIVAIKTSSDGIVIQRVSQARPPATDFRLVQAGVNANGLGALLAGIAGTLPTIVYTPSNVSLINLTGVAARSVGYALGALLIALAFLPKVAAVLLTIPSPVMGAFLLMIAGLLLVEGMRMVMRDGMDHRKSLVVGVSLSLGIGLITHNVLVDLIGETWGSSLGNGMTVGILIAIVMSLFIELTRQRHSRLETTLDISVLPEIDEFLQQVASKMAWNQTSTERLRAAGEETLSSLLESVEDYDADAVPSLIIVARPGDNVELEFMAVFDEDNLEDRLALLDEQPEFPVNASFPSGSSVTMQPPCATRNTTE